MKLSRYYLIVLLLFIPIVLIGCQPKEENKMQQSSGAQTDKRIIAPTTNDPIKPDFKTKISEYTVDVDLDNKEEKIVLYTAAGRDSKGNMLWDDGQKWLLVVEDDKTFYPLLSEYVQIGQVYFSVYFQGESQIPMINVIVSTGANLKLSNYVFDKEKQGFREDPLYDSEGINRMYTSLPSY